MELRKIYIKFHEITHDNDFHTFVFLTQFTTCSEFQLTCPFDFERVSAFLLNLFEFKLSGINQQYSIVWV